MSQTREEAYEYTREWRLRNQEHLLAYYRQYNQEHRQERREYARRRYQENRELFLQIAQKYYLAHQGALQEKSRHYRTEHPEKAHEAVRRWAKENHQKRALYEQIRRARKRANGGSFTIRELNDLFAQQEGFCAYCGELLYQSFDSEFHVEHKIPVSKGGSSDIENIALACSKCNLAKGNLTDEEFTLKLGGRRV
jgi:5-methylcytosine-specific restriction endonuclease McrA